MTVHEEVRLVFGTLERRSSKAYFLPSKYVISSWPISIYHFFFLVLSLYIYGIWLPFYVKQILLDLGIKLPLSTILCGICLWCQLKWTSFSKMVCKYWFGFGNKSEQISIYALSWVYPNKPTSFIFKNAGTDWLSLKWVPHLSMCINHLQGCLLLPGHSAFGGRTPSKRLPCLKTWWGYFTERTQLKCSWKQKCSTRSRSQCGKKGAGLAGDTAARLLAEWANWRGKHWNILSGSTFWGLVSVSCLFLSCFWHRPSPG